MGFSPHSRRRAWFDFVYQQRVCGIPLTSAGINIISRRLEWALHQICEIYRHIFILVQSNVQASISFLPRKAPIQTNINRIAIKTAVPLRPFLLLIILALWHPAAAFAGPPLLPAAFYGNITTNNSQTTLNSDTVVIAAIDGVELARGSVFTNEDVWVYTLKVPADDPSTELIDGGRPGDTVTFSINGQILATAPWQGGSNTQVDLSFSTVEAAAPVEAPGLPSLWPWLLVALALLLIFVFWFLFIRPQLRKT